MIDFTLAPVAKVSAPMTVTIQDKRIIVFHGDGFEITATSQWREIVKNTNTFPCFLNKFSMTMGTTVSDTSTNMMASSNGNIFPRYWSVTRSFNVSFGLRLKQQLRKLWRRRWFETPSRSLLRQCSDGPRFTDDIFKCILRLSTFQFRSKLLQRVLLKP